MLIKTVFAGSFTMTDAILIEYFLALYTEIIAFVCRLTGSGQPREKKLSFAIPKFIVTALYGLLVIWTISKRPEVAFYVFFYEKNIQNTIFWGNHFYSNINFCTPALYDQI